jgi:hypothetical protein
VLTGGVEEYEELIRQLKAEKVGKEEALNPTLIWPRVQS